ncbi:uncharacterized protein [Dermacentor albipictus]|uniref:uncharacterized protein isoform X1 n=1 Tax=Dermacentor albipictus TaxID=60249 RepID=UPI0038FCB7BE
MRRWVSEDTTTTATHDDKGSRSTATGATYTADDTPSAGFARAGAPTCPAQDVSLGQLTYSVNSNLPSSAQCKAPPCERHPRLHAVWHRGCQSDGQLRPTLLPPPPRQPVNATPPLPPVPEGQQMGMTSQRAHGVLHQGQGGQCAQHPAETTQWTSGSPTCFTAGSFPLIPWHWRRSRCSHGADSGSSSYATTSSTSSSSTTSSSSSSDTAPVLPARAGCESSKGAVAPKSTGAPAESTRRDVATATDAPPSEHDSRWRKWMGGERLLIAGAALLSVLLVASAAATTASIVDRRSTAASVAGHRLRDGAAGAGVAPTEPLIPGMVRFTESPRRDDAGANEASLGASWKTPPATSEPAEEDLTTEQPGAAYGNASGDMVTAEDLLALPFRRAAKPECGAVFYTYCRKPRREFFYRASLNACLAAADDWPAQLCNRGPNRFTSWRECEASCVLMEPPLEACLDKTLLLGCRRQDVRIGWWWFDGRVCLAWNFPAGGCPANDSAVFATADQCKAHCTNPRYPPCAAPGTRPCSSEQLKFPFFAAGAPSSAVEGGRHCFRLTRRVLESHRCLTGANRFLTKAACESACKKAPSTRP